METRPPLNWMPPPPLPAPRIKGSWLSLGPLVPERDAEPLWNAFGGDGPEGADHHLRWFGWDAMRGPADLLERLGEVVIESGGASCLFRSPAGEAVGMASYLAMVPAHGVVEIGYVAHGLEIAGRQAATEAQYLLLAQAFDAGYRRVEWKCHAGNEPSRRAADRLGYRHEGTFRQHRVARDHNRDTAWFSMLDREWPERRAAFLEFLRPLNFDDEGKQRTRLRRRPIDAVRPGEPRP